MGIEEEGIWWARKRGQLEMVPPFRADEGVNLLRMDRETVVAGRVWSGGRCWEIGGCFVTILIAAIGSANEDTGGVHEFRETEGVVGPVAVATRSVQF